MPHPPGSSYVEADAGAEPAVDGGTLVAIVSTNAPESARPAPGVVLGAAARRHGTTSADLLVAGLALGLTLAAADGAPALALLVLPAAWMAVLWFTGRRAGVLAGRPATAPLRAAVALGISHWLASMVVPLPVTAIQVLSFVAIAGVGSEAARLLLARYGAGAAPLRALVLGSADDAALVSEASGGRLTAVGWCDIDRVAVSVRALGPDVVVAFPDPRIDGRPLQRVAWHLEACGIPLVVSTRLGDVAPTRTRVTRTGGLNLVEVQPAERRGVHAIVKALGEPVAAALGIVVLAPLLIAIAIAIAVALDSPGPVLFRQTRIGRDGRPFTMLKFRTMQVDADHLIAGVASECDGVLFKLRADPRVTRVGRLLRRYSLDELPQLVNVVLGQMSLVGPRPALPAEVAAYDRDPRRRLVVKPGLTGLWQVSGRSDLSWSESVRLDLDYVDNWSLGRDLGIIARTLQAVLAHRGAY